MPFALREKTPRLQCVLENAAPLIAHRPAAYQGTPYQEHRGERESSRRGRHTLRIRGSHKLRHRRTHTTGERICRLCRHIQRRGNDAVRQIRRSGATAHAAQEP